MCVANVIFGKERLTEQFLLMCFFYDSVILWHLLQFALIENFYFLIEIMLLS